MVILYMLTDLYGSKGCKFGAISFRYGWEDPIKHQFKDIKSLNLLNIELRILTCLKVQAHKISHLFIFFF